MGATNFTENARWFTNLKVCKQTAKFPLFPVKRFIAQRIYAVCKRINYKIIPVTNLSKYLEYSTSGTE